MGSRILSRLKKQEKERVMTKEEVTMIGFEIVAYAGEARSKLLMAIKEAENSNFEKAEKLVAEANEVLLEAHGQQTEMIQKEAAGETNELGFIMVHAQDHLMTAMLLKDLTQHFINLYKKSN